MFKVFPCSLSSSFFIPFSIITSPGEEGAGLCAYHAFICLFVLYVLVFVLFFSSSWCWRLAAVVIVALPGLFY